MPETMHRSIRLGIFTLGGLVLLTSSAWAHLSIIRQGEESSGFREDGDLFGGAVTYGDFNGDGFDDLATGAPWEGAGSTARVGQVAINYGSSEGLTHVAAALLEPGQLGLSLHTDMRFGNTLAVGDLNRDGYDDLVVGMPTATYNGVSLAGWIGMYYGSSNGLQPWVAYAQEHWNGFSQYGDFFGQSIVISDFNNDLYPDVAVGSPGQGQQAGTVFVRYGAANGPFGADQLFTAEDLGASYQIDDYFGLSLAAGNVIGDTRKDLIVGAPHRDAFGQGGAGVCYMVPGSNSGLVEGAALSFTAKVVDDCAAQADFGMSLATTSVGVYDRIFIGEPDRYLGSVQRAGRVVAVMGSVDGPNYDTGVALTRDMFDGPSGDDERFGLFLASGRFEDDNFDDLMIGSPLADFVGSDAGICHLLLGGVSGIGNEGYYVYSQTPIGETPETADLLGYGLSLGGEFDSSNRGTAVIGAPGEDDYAGLVHVVAPWRQFYFQTHKTACVMDCQGELVYTQKPFEQVYIASTTKIMTVLLACERASLSPGDPDYVDLDTSYTVPAWVANNIGGSSADLIEGETVTLEDLMHMALLISGNDAAHAIADLLYGSLGPEVSLPLFVQRMNERADEIGMFDTAFNNPNGFEQEAVGRDLGDHYSTAYDMALLSKEALRNAMFREISTTSSYTAARILPTGAVLIDNFNSFQSWILNNNMGITGTGLKGGFTPAAQTTWCVSARGRFGDAVATTFGTVDGPTARQDAGRLIGLGVGNCMTIELWEDWQFRDVYVQGGITASALNDSRIRSGSQQTYSQQMNLFHASAEVAETNARIVVSREAEVAIEPNGEAHYGIGPFEGHEEIRITNLETWTTKIKVETPLFSSFFNIAPGGSIVVPSGYGPTEQFDWILESHDGSGGPLHLLVEEEYFYEVFEPAEPTTDPVFSVVIQGDPQLRDNQVIMDIDWFSDGFDYVFVSHPPETVVSGMEDSGLELPGGTSLHLQPAFPNPFENSTAIRFTLTDPAEVGVSIFDATGRRVRTYSPELKSAGQWSLNWDGRTDRGVSVAPGVYFYRVESGGESGGGGKLTRIGRPR